jgi:hypothetical protein
MSEPAPAYVHSEGVCPSCGLLELLRAGGTLPRPICAVCLHMLGLAPAVLRDLRKRRLAYVTIEGLKIRTSSRRAVELLAKQMAAKYRREEAEKAAAS